LLIQRMSAPRNARHGPRHRGARPTGFEPATRVERTGVVGMGSGIAAVM
jgi:hypothetical protein